jgi:UDP-N-acetylglucosamine diphosphorylase / glucose-1-phosphate thymidylyltransferase / UDP-N-acetylgalactosamine diphosphorylase / glucosamine-1-phosphate N-acetyltransferase / galactosamine-1-phosphate N-acetyltransferase
MRLRSTLQWILRCAMNLHISDFTGALNGTPFAACADAVPWELTASIDARMREAIATLDARDWQRQGDTAIHRTATVEPGAQLKGPIVIGPACFVSATALLRGGVWLAERCSVGPGCELKSSWLGAGSKLAHLSFIGDSVIGSDVNFEAGSIVANHRNERDDKRIRVHIDGALHTLEITKFGAMVGDRVRIGANAVLAPGTLLAANSVVPRLSSIDQENGARS